MDLNISNCVGGDFEFMCPKKWSELQSTYVEGIRFCSNCEKNVYWCHSPADVKLQISVDHCLAMSESTYRLIRESENDKEAFLLEQKIKADSELNAPDTRPRFVGVWKRSP